MRELALPGMHVWRRAAGTLDEHAYFIVHEDGNIALDPLPLDEDSARQIELLGGVRTVVLTDSGSERDGGALRARFGANVAALSDGKTIAHGIVAIAVGERYAIHIPRSKCAIAGLPVTGAPIGAITIALTEDRARREAAFALRRLWALRLNALLVTHGYPVVTGADDALATAIEAELGDDAHRINTGDVRWERDDADPELYRAEMAEIGLPIGARKLGYRLISLGPGQWFCPLHAHSEEEEMLFVLDGSPTVRSLRGDMTCRPGDFVAFPCGKRGAHQIGNESGRPCRLLMLGMETGNEVAFYPNSRKVLIHRDLMLRAEPSLDYYDGE